MISYFDFARQILLGKSYDDKLLGSEIEWGVWIPFELPTFPGRNQALSFSDEQLKFPKKTRLSEPDKAAQAIHSFANHELLAIEMMAAALLIYPHHTSEDIRFKKGILASLRDEQKHLSLYVNRLKELGHDLGDFPLNDYFWRQMDKLKTPGQYTAVMALTFEAANLDFAKYYSGIFRELGDERTSGILDLVLEDEMTHVSFGAYWMKRWKQDKNLWDYYLSCLPFPLTPARSKGIGFNSGLHGRAINDEYFLSELINYNDDFKITNRGR